MVNFSVFNELSLPLDTYKAKEQFGIFINILNELSNKGLNQIRMSDDFKNYQILNNVTLEQFLGQQNDPDFRTRLRGFVSSKIVKINSPIIQKCDEEQIQSQQTNEYYYENIATDSGLACCDIWNTIAVSFNSNAKWDENNIRLIKKTINKDAKITKDIVQIKHASEKSHLYSHKDFFNDLQKNNKQKITTRNFWENKEVNFPNKIKFCPEVKEQIQGMDKAVFDGAIGILRDVETERKKITDYNWSSESKTVNQNSQLKKYRMFTVEEEKTFIENHIKSLPNKCRIYFLEQGDKIYIGYIGKHLPLE